MDKERDMKAAFVKFMDLPIVRAVILNLYLVAISALEYWYFQVSCDTEWYEPTLVVILYNICIHIVFNYILAFIFAKEYITGFVSLPVTFLWAEANYYTALFHGMPLTFGELRNFKTAMSVFGSYGITIGERPVKVALIFFVSMLLTFAVMKYEKGRFEPRRFSIGRMIVVIPAVIWFVVGMWGPNPIKPKDAKDWKWQWMYGLFGYTNCLIDDLKTRGNAIVKPEGYEAEDVDSICSEYMAGEPADTVAASGNEQPDIVLILNETFYDLKRIYDFETDRDYLEKVHSMDDLYSGYAVVPNLRGGTNASEYELLTSNSLAIMKAGITPFNILDLRDRHSIVSHMNALGYQTLGTHPAPGNNYNRINGYKDMGFDEIKFEEAYTDTEQYYDRELVTDKSAYDNVISWYEDMDSESPRFVYLLTIQNHADYDTNAPECDTIHVTEGDFDDVQKINEYLSCISLSDEAFYDLTRYFENYDRKVIVCMMGDHCPSFVTDDTLPETESADEANILLREVPLYIWANYDLENTDRDLGEMSLMFVMPTLLKMADISPSYYYRYINDVKEISPIITTDGRLFDREGKEVDIKSDPSKAAFTDDYFKIEYSNVAGKKYIDEFFR